MKLATNSSQKPSFGALGFPRGCLGPRGTPEIVKNPWKFQEIGQGVELSREAPGSPESVGIPWDSRAILVEPPIQRSATDEILWSPHGWLLAHRVDVLDGPEAPCVGPWGFLGLPGTQGKTGSCLKPLEI